MIERGRCCLENLAIDGSGLSRNESFSEVAEDSIGNAEDARVDLILGEAIEVGDVGSSDVDVFDVRDGSCEL